MSYRTPFFVIVFFVFFVVSIPAQPTGYVEVPIRHLMAGERGQCIADEGVYDAGRLAALRERANCADLVDSLEYDPDTETLVRYSVGGDCHMRIAIRAFRLDARRRYEIVINNIWGGCRAGGRRSGWLAIAKPPDGYSIATRIVLVDRESGNSAGSFVFESEMGGLGLEWLDTKQIETEGCIRLYDEKTLVISDRQALLAAIRNDASRERCVAALGSIDFAANDLAGIEINSGYCRTPAGLEYSLVKNTSARELTLNVSWLDPHGRTCRALSRYDLWLLIPKVPAGYELRFVTSLRD